LLEEPRHKWIMSDANYRNDLSHDLPPAGNPIRV
jgi:hypothetical protein